MPDDRSLWKPPVAESASIYKDLYLGFEVHWATATSEEMLISTDGS